MKRPASTVRLLSLYPVLTALLAPSLAAQELFDADFYPGMVATYSNGNQSVSRIDSTFGFDWGSEAPDPRLPNGDFSAEWTSGLLVKSSGQHRFHVFVAGSVEIQIDGEVVLTASHPWGFVSGKPVDLSAGDYQLKVTYRTPEESDKPRARLSVFWSSDQFTLEPIPADVLYREELDSAEVSDFGGALADAYRCYACHTPSAPKSIVSEVVAGPSLHRVNGSQSRKLLVQRLMAPKSVVANSHMPNFGFRQSEAVDIAAFLTSISKDAHASKSTKTSSTDVEQGRRLLLSVGCVACHAVSEKTAGLIDPLNPYDAPDLQTVGDRRSAAWLERWLRDPATLNENHRMPKFDLSNDQRRQIVAALTAASGDKAQNVVLDNVDFENASIETGRRLVRAANCAACHAIPGMKAVRIPIPTDSHGSERHNCAASIDSSRQKLNDGRRQPAFGFGQVQQDAVVSWWKAADLLSARNNVDAGAIVLARNNCLSCHDRDAVRGLSTKASKLQRLHAELAGQSQGLVPPSLTAVGDKLTADYLSTAVAGKQKEQRLPWLLVQMPRFEHSPTELATLLQHLQTKDLIPDEADVVRTDVLSHVDLTGEHTASTEELLIGNQLTGAGGFNCVACHQAGPFQPRNVALGTRGSDIMTMGARIRPRYFQRWMKNPIRVVAGIEMPAIRKGMPDVLEGSLPHQLGVIWTALADPRFTPPTVTSRFEQIAFVEADSPALVLRDVFTIGTDSSRFDPVARAFAVGLPNGHNVLMDLDTMNVRLWTYGEFARQRTEGKSWYWDMPGVVVRYPQETNSIQAVETATGRRFSPVEDEGRVSELLSYHHADDAVIVRSRSWFRPADAPATVSAEPPHSSVTAWSSETDPLTPVVFEHTLAPDSECGFQHAIRILDGPSDWVLAKSTQEDLSTEKDGGKRLVSSRIDVKRTADGRRQQLTYAVSGSIPGRTRPKFQPTVSRDLDVLTSTPGFRGHRLPIPSNIMPTAMTWMNDGRMAFTSLKGHVWIASDTDEDGIPDQTHLFEEGLAAPFGIIADGESLLVAHKPEVLRLTDTNGDGRADRRDVVASGWGYSDNYHDWASGLVRDANGNLYVGLGSDYSQNKRSVKNDRWRGGVVKIDPSGVVTPFSMSMRYPMDVAIDRYGHVFATDNQGVQNTFNEINHLMPGRHYGVPSRHQPPDKLTAEAPAVMVPHPWSRSVNSILFLPDNFAIKGLRGHGIGCEYDSRFLMRFTIQDVNGTLQGASYRFSLPDQEAGGSNFIGPICAEVSPGGDLYVGSIWDSGWQGGRNTGGIARLVADPKSFRNGIGEVRAIAGGFEVKFFQPVDSKAATNAENWKLQAFTRKWGGNYSTPDSGRFTPVITSLSIDDSGRIVTLRVPDQRAGYLYDIAVEPSVGGDSGLWPSEAHYGMKVVP